MFQLPELKAKEIIIYLRKSRADDPAMSVDEVLARHAQLLDEWTAQHVPDGPIPLENVVREVASGETLRERPKMQEVLRRIESPKIKAILIVEPQRLSRGDLEDAGRIINALRYTKTLAVTPQYAYDCREEMDRENLARELKRGNEFLEYIKKIMDRGRRLAVQNGYYVGSCPPYGYERIPVKDGNRDCWTLEPKPAEAAVVRQIFDLYVNGGLGYHKIANQLDALAIKPVKGANWSRHTVREILQNRHYIGQVFWDRRKTEVEMHDGELRASRPVAEEFLIYEAKHPAIVDRELFDAARKIRESYAQPPTSGDKEFKNPLAGLIYCQCGSHMVRRKRYGGRADRYLCAKQHLCGTVSASVDEVLAAVQQVLREVIDDFEIRIDAGVDDSAELHRQAVERMRARVAELEELEVKQWDEKLAGKMPPHVFDRLNGQLLEEKGALTEKLCVMENSTPEPLQLKEKHTSFSEALDLLTDPDAPALEKNRLLRECVERLTYSRERDKPTGRITTPIELHAELRV